MDRTALGTGLLPSVLDRLTDADSEGTAAVRGYTAAEMMEAIRRDLEDLFNTHQSDPQVPEAFAEVRRSVAAFGLPDLPTLSERTGGRPEEMRGVIHDVVVRFEPRLKDVRVVLAEAEPRENRRVRFHIEARLNVEPSPEVAFETVLELVTGHASIRSGEG
jgi:type VI secretion system protein ImpF